VETKAHILKSPLYSAFIECVPNVFLMCSQMYSPWRLFMVNALEQ
jgi:hypothetical protein